MWLDVAIAMSCGGAGLICGWIAHAMGGLGNATTDSDASSSQNKVVGPLDSTPKPIAKMAYQKQPHARPMVADVDTLQPRSPAARHLLLDADDASHETVLQAVSELIASNEEIQTLLKEAHDRIHEQSMQIESAEHRAQTDALTRLPNRRAFDDYIRAFVSLDRDRTGTLALLDVDHFKRFNDLYGHRAGDEVLRVVGNILHSRLQSYGLVCRVGGEEFAIILDGIPVQNAQILVERARMAIGERDIFFEDKRLRVTASVGMSELGPGQSIGDWFQQADTALYRSKDAGRDCGHWLDGSVARRIDIGRRSSAHESSHNRVKRAEDTEIGTDAPSSSVMQLQFPNQKPKPAKNPLNEDCPRALFDQVRDLVQSDVSIALMAIRCHQASNDTMNSLLRVARAATRRVDRIGWFDESTILVCMPSIELAMAIQQGRQICRGAVSIGLQWKGSCPRPISIGIVQADSESTYETMVSRAVRLANLARNSFTDPISVSP